MGTCTTLGFYGYAIRHRGDLCVRRAAAFHEPIYSQHVFMCLPSTQREINGSILWQSKKYTQMTHKKTSHWTLLCNCTLMRKAQRKHTELPPPAGCPAGLVLGSNKQLDTENRLHLSSRHQRTPIILSSYYITKVAFVLTGLTAGLLQNYCPFVQKKNIYNNIKFMG